MEKWKFNSKIGLKTCRRSKKSYRYPILYPNKNQPKKVNLNELWNELDGNLFEITIKKI